MQTDSLIIRANTNNDHLNFALLLQNAKGSQFNLYRTSFAGFIANNQADFTLGIDDAKNKRQYNFGALLSQVPAGVKFVLKHDSLVLNYEPWEMAADNYIQYDS